MRVLRRAFPSATLAPADELLSELRSIKTPAEIEHIHDACRIAADAFARGVQVLGPGVSEAEAAAAFRIRFELLPFRSSRSQALRWVHVLHVGT